ncbi:MAG: glycosyltransferase [Anaerolineales bacterium]|nr:glycosyltransferase [Anaerolineales bacterium]
MKIAHVTATFPPYYAGTGLVAYHQSRELAARGHEVTVFTSIFSAKRSEPDPPGVIVRRLRPLIRIGNAPFLPSLLGLRDFDLIHLHHPFIFGSEMIYATSRLRNIPYVLTHHNDLIGDGLRTYLFDVYSAIFTPLVFHRASKFAAVSLEHARHSRLNDLFQSRWNDVIEVSNGVDISLFCPEDNGRSLRSKFGIPDDDPIILFVGVLDRAHHYKGLDKLLEAFSQLNRPNSHLIVVGDGDLKVDFQRRVQDMRIEDRTYFAGLIPNQELPEFYRGADVLVQPSLVPESFGLCLVESLACGKPVIASDWPGVRAVVSDKVDGMLIRPGDIGDLVNKIQMIIDDPGLKQYMGQQGRLKVEEKFSWPKVVDRLEAIYLYVV